MSCSTCPARDLINIPSTEPIEPGCGKLNTYDWLKDIPDTGNQPAIVEVRFKNTRKEFFTAKPGLIFKAGDYVAVEAERGHDIGQVTLTGQLARLQYKKKNPRDQHLRSIYRKASPSDLEKWHISKLKERPVMLKARQLASELKLDMKISDVEFQGDGLKAIFYYIAEGRVDFRELIKLYAKEFNIRIEMKQIGARQEAAMVGGIGSCGKELCCSSWRTNLSTVLTNAARIQELPHNAQKLTGQCGKLKCCLMYELDSYLEAQSDFPDILLELETEKGIAYPKKKDVLNKIVFYSYSEKDASHAFPVSTKEIKEVIMLNKKGIKPVSIGQNTGIPAELSFVSATSDASILRQKSREQRQKNKKKY